MVVSHCKTADPKVRLGHVPKASFCGLPPVPWGEFHGLPWLP